MAESLKLNLTKTHWT